MYVCVCNAVTDRQIKDAVAEGADTLAKLQKCLPVSTCCGSCIQEVQGFLTKVDTHKQKQKPTRKTFSLFHPGKTADTGLAS